MKKLLPICLLLCCIACSRPRTVTRGFYFWKQRYQLDSLENQTLRALHIRKLYVKMFDVTLDTDQRTVVPVARLNKRDSFPPNTAIIPVVFIANSIWEQANTDTLARQITNLLSQMSPQQVAEVQMDCDWTRGTKNAYFAFLEALRRQPFLHGKEISATIRLHQVKYLSGSGIPPVNKGLLMCYNMGNLRQYGDHNSILDMNDLKAYTKGGRIAGYPLKLDIALPLFSWSVIFRDQNYAGLLSNLDDYDYQSFEKKGEYLYTVKKDTVMKGYTLYAGDELRHETCPPELLRKAARYISRQRQDYDPTVIFFHLDANTISSYALPELETTYNILR